MFPRSLALEICVEEFASSSAGAAFAAADSSATEDDSSDAEASSDSASEVPPRHIFRGCGAALCGIRRASLAISAGLGCRIRGSSAAVFGRGIGCGCCGRISARSLGGSRAFLLCGGSSNFLDACAIVSRCGRDGWHSEHPCKEHGEREGKSPLSRHAGLCPAMGRLLLCAVLVRHDASIPSDFERKKFP